MVQLLEDLQDCKHKLRSAMETVEAERDRLKGYQVDISLSCIDDFLIDGSGGALTGLLAYRGTEMYARLSDEEQDVRGRNAEELQHVLLALVAKHKANQHEHNEHIFGAIQEIATQFTHDVHSTASTFTADIAALRSVITACSPANIHAAHNVSHALVETLCELTVSTKGVTSAVQNVLLKDPHKSALKAAELHSLPRGAGGRFNSGDSAANLSPSEIDALIAQNEALKTRIEQMRKNTAQLRNNVASSQINQSSSSSSSAKKAPQSSQRRPSKERSHNYSDNDEEKDDSGFEPDTSGPLDLASLEVPQTETLPGVVAEYLFRFLCKHVQGLLETHPMAATGIPLDIFQETSKELATQVTAPATTALLAFVRHKGVSDATLTGLEGVRDVGVIADDRLRSVIIEGVRHSVQVGSVHSEITALSTLYLTYLHSRLGLKGSLFPTAAPVATTVPEVVVSRSSPPASRQKQQQQQ
eukprot:gene33920-41839_t